jgi:hypothetical protein
MQGNKWAAVPCRLDDHVASLGVNSPDNDDASLLDLAAESKDAVRLGLCLRLTEGGSIRDRPPLPLMTLSRLRTV